MQEHCYQRGPVDNKLEFLYEKKVDTTFFVKQNIICMSPSDSQNIKALLM